KSIKQLKLDCIRINILIGEPNTGKSNILESLGIFSFGGYSSGNTFRSFVRFERTSNLFYDENLDEPVRISLDDMNFGLSFKDGSFDGEIHAKEHLAAKISGNYDNIESYDPKASFSFAEIGLVYINWEFVFVCAWNISYLFC
ncbi:hypothetical protein KJ766_04145, partial [Patescibacteria group bacterium]|nr:hypothetical protein [Patescibacteria group bacterium]